MAKNIEVFYTGGGVTLAEAELDGGRYAVVSTECPDILTIYNRVEDDEPYMPEIMVGSYGEGEMDEDQKELHRAMLEKLRSS